jgi:hypothetical protein
LFNSDLFHFIDRVCQDVPINHDEVSELAGFHRALIESDCAEFDAVRQ